MLRSALPHSADSCFVWILPCKRRALKCLRVTALGKDRLQLAMPGGGGQSRHSTRPVPRHPRTGPCAQPAPRQQRRRPRVPTARTSGSLHTRAAQHAHSTIRCPRVCSHGQICAHACAEHAPPCLAAQTRAHARCSLRPCDTRACSTIPTDAPSTHSCLPARTEHARGTACTAQSPAWTLARTDARTRQPFCSAGPSGRAGSKAAGTGPVPGDAEQSRGTAACPELPPHTHSQALSLQ